MLYDLMSEPFLGEKSTIQSKQQIIKMMPRLDPTGVVLTQVNQCLAKELSDAQNLITSQDNMFENLA